MLLQCLSVMVAFLATVVLIWLLAPFAWRFGWLDNPDSRKKHVVATPLTGGVAMLGGILAASFLHAGMFESHGLLFVAMALLCIEGLVDDLFNLAPLQRLFLQMSVILLFCMFAGPLINRLGNLFGFGQVVLNTWQALLLTAICIMGVVNAINMIDGVDGLAGGVILIALLWICVLAYMSGFDFRFPLVIAGAVAGFLCFNLRTPFRQRAGVFMGDSGSTMLGLALAWLLVNISLPSTSLLSTEHLRPMPPVLVFWLLAVPLCDTASLVFKRGLRGKSPFKADRDHIHHILIRSGLGDGQVTLVVMVASCVLAAIGVAGWLLGMPEYALFYGFLLFFALYYYGLHHSEQVVRLLRGRLATHSST